jgi:RHS repeat-associated protein
LDRVLSRTSGGATATYTYQGLGETLARTVVGSATTNYASTPGGPLAQRVGTTTRYYLRDPHGDLVGWSNTSGTLVGTALYDPWGQLLSATGEMGGSPPAQGAFRFQSQLTDALSGQVDMLTRLYEPTLGRFSSRDVLFGDPTNPNTLNQFVYGGASPVTYSDPTGMYLVGDGGGGCDRKCVEKVESGEWTLEPPAQDPPDAPQPAGVFARVMFNDQLSLAERLEAARQLQTAYGEQGEEIVELWMQGLADSMEASTWSQITNHALSSYFEGCDQVPDWIEYTGWGMIAVGGGFVACAAAFAACATAGSLTPHAMLRMTQRGIGVTQVDAAVRAGARFEYAYRGASQVGYYDSATKVFVATRGGAITTVFRAGPAYIKNLIG